jgi:hypothetical protein
MIEIENIEFNERLIYITPIRWILAGFNLLFEGRKEGL